MSLPKHLALEIVTPDHAIVHEEVDEVQIPGAEGYLGVLPGHTPMLVMLQVGEFWYRKGAEKTYLSLAFGFAEILPDRVTILAQIAERPEDIDVDRQVTVRQEAEREMAEARSEADVERARLAMMTAMMRMRVAERARLRK